MKTVLLAALLTVSAVATPAPKASAQTPKRSKVGTTVSSADKSVTLTLIGKKQNYDYRDTLTLDQDVFSPKSVRFHPDGTRFYVNSLEGCATVVYDAVTFKKLRVIHHDFGQDCRIPRADTTTFYRFTHYPGARLRPFRGKPVESTFSHGGRYLWVPYYRRTFDINAQDPSAVALIDTRLDSIVRLFDTGPLPKMVATSPDGHWLAVTHWGDNTVGLIDITGDDPAKWKQLPPIAIGQQLRLNYSLTQSVNRDSGSGYSLRGTVFTPDNRYLIVSEMAGIGLGVIDLKTLKHIGTLTGISNARHLIIVNDCLYASRNVAGQVWQLPMDTVMSAIGRLQGNNVALSGWKSCNVGGGARTIESSPSGRFLFAACNVASQLHVVDTRTMTDIASIQIDSYPVGLDVSADGRIVVVTSQAHPGKGGGNAVNILSVSYGDSLAEATAAARAAAPADTLQAASAPAAGTTVSSVPGWLRRYAVPVAAVAVVAVLAGVFLGRRKRK